METLFSIKPNETVNSTLETEIVIAFIFERHTLCYQVLASFLAILICILGFVGNILVIVVVLKRRSMHTTTNCYLFSLAFADLLLLLSAALPATAEPFYLRYEWPWGHMLCSLAVFVQYLGANASALSISAFTIERYIAICHPMKAQIMCTTQRAKKIIIFLWCFALIYCAPWLGLSQIITEIDMNDDVLETCGYRLERYQYRAYYIFDLVIFYIIPLIITAVLYSLIVFMLYNTTVHYPIRKKYSVDRRSTTGSSRRQVVKMLIVIVVVFCIMWLPYRSVVVYNSYSEQGISNVWFWLVCRMMVYTNSAINPILYSAMSVKFREAFMSILCGRHTAKQRCRQCSNNYCEHTPAKTDSIRKQNFCLVTSATGHTLHIETNETIGLNEKISDEDRCSSCVDENGYLNDNVNKLNGSVSNL